MNLQTIKNNWRAILATLPLPMLALAASYGVYSFAKLFVPWIVAVIQASAFEATYIGLAVVQVGDDQRRRARAISIGAVVVSVAYNSLAGLFHRQPDLLQGLPILAECVLAILHGAPLAWVAFLVSDLLLHRNQQPATPRTTIKEQPNADPVASNTSNISEAARVYSCKHCNAVELTKAEQLAHGRNRARYGSCLPASGSVPAAD